MDRHIAIFLYIATVAATVSSLAVPSKQGPPSYVCRGGYKLYSEYRVHVSPVRSSLSGSQEQCISSCERETYPTCDALVYNNNTGACDFFSKDYGFQDDELNLSFAGSGFTALVASDECNSNSQKLAISVFKKLIKLLNVQV